MRLHLDTSSAAGSAEAANANSLLSATGKANGDPTTSGGGTTGISGHSSDSEAVSGTSSAWSTSFSDRASRIGQLAAAVQGGTCHISSAAISQSIISSAVSTTSAVSAAASSAYGIRSAWPSASH